MKEPGKQSERRRFPRIQVDFAVTVHWGRRRYQWRAHELSEYGILLASPQPQLVGEELQLELSLKHNQSPIRLLGVVAYATESGIGVRFKNIPPEQQAILKDYTQEHGIGIVKR